MREILDFLFNELTPGMALAGGVQFPPCKHEDKPDLMVAKGGNFFGNIGKMFGGGGKKVSYQPNYKMQQNTPPAAPPVPPPQAPPPPPPLKELAAPTMINSGAMTAGYEEQKKNADKFGFRSSMLRSDSSTATGSKSLLGN